MAEGITNTGFYREIRVPFSEALEVAQIATDPNVDHRGQDALAYPPVLTPEDFAHIMLVMSDIQLGSPSKRDLAANLRKRLYNWVADEFFEVVPLPISDDEDVPVNEFGFRITEKGMRALDNPLRDHGVAFINRADKVRKHLEQVESAKTA